MTAKLAYRLEAYNSSNPNEITLHVRDDPSVHRLAMVFPEFSKSGGHKGQLLDPDYRRDLLSYQGGKSCEDGADAMVWPDGYSKFEHIAVSMSIDFAAAPEGGTDLYLTTKTWYSGPSLLRLDPAVVVSRRVRCLWDDLNPNVRRETAKAVANFLNVTLDPQHATEEG